MPGTGNEHDAQSTSLLSCTHDGSHGQTIDQKNLSYHIATKDGGSIRHFHEFSIQLCARQHGMSSAWDVFSSDRQLRAHGNADVCGQHLPLGGKTAGYKGFLNAVERGPFLVAARNSLELCDVADMCHQPIRIHLR